MNSRFTALLLMSVGVCVVPVAEAVQVETLPLWHVEAGPSWWLNTKLSYQALPPADPSTAARTDRFYDDGYNRVDASNNIGDGSGGVLASRTGYFGYVTAGQVSLGAGTLTLHQLRAPPVYLPAPSLDREPGIDIAIRRSLARDPAVMDWGVELGADFSSASHRWSGSEQLTLRLLTDTYALGGVVPQPAPYSGRFSPLPGDQRIGDTPTRAITFVSGTITGSRSFNVRTTLIRLGAWVELVPGKNGQSRSEEDRWSVLLRGGPALLCSRASFTSNEQLQSPGLTAPPPVNASGSASSSDLTWFLGARVRRVISPRWALLAWGDFVHGTTLQVVSGERLVSFDSKNSLMVGVALEMSLDN